MRVERLLDRPIITADLHPSIGENIQGPSLIRVPDWIEGALAAYYLYFADHKGRYIRLAYADELTGPWSIHPPGNLQIEDSHFLTEPPAVTEEILAEFDARLTGNAVKMSHDVLTEVTTPHIASPDVHVDAERRRIVMYFHGLEAPGQQVTRVATSEDGILFEALPEVLGRTYLRVFAHDGVTYGLAMPGRLYRSADGLHGFEEGPLLFNPNMRHNAAWKHGDTLWVFWTKVGDAPERILLSTIDLAGDWMEWRETEPVEVLRPERLGGRQRAIGTVDPQHCLRRREPASRPRGLRGARATVPALRRRRRGWDRDCRGDGVGWLTASQSPRPPSTTCAWSI